ncbi:hypothetical protein chiPu_0023176, partial [Chiloscyllium punctatum]|nr:hypothetical protein [Chiloscyllium punctatum]
LKLLQFSKPAYWMKAADQVVPTTHLTTLEEGQASRR